MKPLNWKSLVVSVFAVALLFATGSAGATTLGLVIDGSGSISSGNFATQQTAYVNALNNVIDTSLFGDIAIGVWQFSSGVQQEIGYTTINNAGDLALVTTAISTMTQLNGSTNISGAITVAANAAVNFGPLVNSKLVIDVSTDGFHNQNATTPLSAAQAAVTAGLGAGFTDVNVNALLIGGGAVGGFNTGGGAGGNQSFQVAAGNFSNLQTVLEGKLTREVVGGPGPGPAPIPEPSTVILFGTGLAGLAAWRMKKTKQA